MKIQKSSRITALFLALVMILPLISIPAFAEEAESNVLYSLDFEDAVAGQKPTVADVDDSGVFVEEDGNKYWKISYSGASTSKGKININQNFIIQNTAVSYENTEVLVIELKQYIPADAVGVTDTRFKSSFCTFYEPDGTLTQNKGIDWLNLYRLTATADKLTVTPGGAQDTKGTVVANTFAKGQWLTFDVVIDMINGTYDVYVNEALALKAVTFVGQYGLGAGKWQTGPINNLVVKANTLSVVTPLNCEANKTADTEIYIDDIVFYNSTEGFDFTVFSEDFENISEGDYHAQVKTNNTNGMGAANAKVKKNGDNKYWEIPFAGYNANGEVEGFVCTCGNWDGVDDVTTPPSGGKAGYQLCKCRNVDNNFIIHNNKVSYTAFDELVFAVDYFIEADSHGDITLQFYKVNASVNGGAQATKQYVDLFRIDCKGSTAVITGSGKNVVNYNTTFNKGQWVTVSLVINLDTGSVRGYAGNKLAFTSDLYKDGFLTNITVDANMWNVFKTTSNRADMKNDKGATLIDNVRIYEAELTGFGLGAEQVYSQNFENVANVTSVSGSYPSSAKIVTAADGTHGKVIQVDCTAIGDANKYYLMTSANNNDKPEISGGTIENGVLTGGTVTYNKTTYTVTGAINTTDRTTELTSSTDGTNPLPGDKKWYIVNEVVVDAISGQNNIAKPLYLNVPAVKTAKMTIQADYFFSTDLNRAMDIRLRGGDSEKDYDIFATSISGGKVEFKPHGGLAQLKYDSNKSKVALGQWATLKITFDFLNNTITAYLNGELFMVAYEKDFGSTRGFLNVNKFNLGHFARGASVSTYKGYYQADNISITIDSDNTGFVGYFDDFNGATNDSVNQNFLDWNLTTPKGNTTVETEENGNKYWNIDVDYNDKESPYSNGTKGKNVDFNAIARNGEYSSNTADKIVMEVKYWLKAGTKGEYQSQLRYGGGYGETAKANKSFSNGLNLYTIGSDGTSAHIKWENGNLGLVATYADAVPMNEWVTISSVFDLDAGTMQVYVNGVLALDAKAYSSEYMTKVVFTADSWIVAKAKTASNPQGSIGIDDITIKQFESSKLVDESGKGLVSAKVNGKLVKDSTKFYGTVTDKKYVNAATYGDIVSTYQKASIRLSLNGSDESGLRFISKVDTALLDALFALEDADSVKSVSFGTLIAPTDYYGEGEFTMAALDAAEKIYLEVEGTRDTYFNGNKAGLEDLDEGYAYLAGSIVKIKNGNLDRAFSGRAYVKVELYNGETVVFYSEVIHSVSVQEQAIKTVYADGTGENETKSDYYNGLSDDYKAILDAYVAGPVE